jgi:hypothetical protein
MAKGEKMTEYTDKEKAEIFRKYKVSELKTAQDKLQTILTENGIAPNPHKYAKIFFIDKVKDSFIFCPFCLKASQYSNYKIVTGFYECPFCKNKMSEKTLDMAFDVFTSGNLTPIDFAKWVYGYRLNGFFKKIDFTEWSKKLKELEIALEFWDEYHKLKGENPPIKDNSDKEDKENDE